MDDFPISIHRLVIDMMTIMYRAEMLLLSFCCVAPLYFLCAIEHI